MPTKQTVSLSLLILSILLFSQGILAQETPPVEDTPPDENSIICDLLLEDTTAPLTEAIEAEQIALFSTGGTGASSDFPFAENSLLGFLFEAYGLLVDSVADLDRTAEFIVDMSVAECITQQSALDMVDKIHLARGKKGYLVANLESVNASVYSGLLRQAIALETEVFQTLVGTPVVPGEPVVPEPLVPEEPVDPEQPVAP